MKSHTMTPVAASPASAHAFGDGAVKGSQSPWPAVSFGITEREILERIAQGVPLAETLTDIVRLIEQQADGMLCSVLLLDRKAGCLRHGAAPSLPTAYVQAIDGTAIGPAVGSCGAAAYLGERVSVEDIATHPNWLHFKDLALSHDLRACWSSPILFPEGGVLGTLAMYYHVARLPQSHEIMWVNAATHLAAIAIGRHQSEENRARLEAQLRQSQKMQLLGTLAGGIAHDFNNILTSIVGHTELAIADTAAGHPAQEHLGHVERAARRAANLVRQILTFGRQGEAKRLALDLVPVVEEALQFLRSSLLPNIQIKYIPPTAPLFIVADANQIHQVVMNLGINAAHAMRGRGGVLEVRLSDVVVDAELAACSADLKPGPYVRLTVSDSGCGMDPATQEHIFEPFFTTKEPGQGTGLGLSVVHGIVQTHAGAIVVNSNPGVETTFHVYFPEVEP